MKKVRLSPLNTVAAVTTIFHLSIFCMLVWEDDGRLLEIYSKSVEAAV